jgi:NTE family protein
VTAPEQLASGPPVRTRRVSSPRAVLAVAVLGSFMAFVDATIVNIAVPNIAHDFSGSRLSSVSWVLNAYNIVFAAFLVGGGQLADLLGRRRVFSFALLAFTLGSVLCAIAPTLGLLIAARVLQAAGSAMLVPSSLAIVLEAHAEHERMHAVALWSAVAALAAGVGPPLGGLLITASDWRLVFLVNVPVGAVAFVLAQRVLIESRAPGRRRMPDLLGGGVLALCIAALVLAVVKGQEWGWASARVLGTVALAVLLGVYFTLRSARHRTPVVDLALLRIRSFSLSNGVTIVMAGGFYAYTLCNVLFLTGVWRYSILSAGLALTPGPFTAMAVAGPASRLVERVGHRAVVVPGALIWAGGMAFFATALGARPDFLGNWLPGMLILGTGAGLTFPTLSGAAVGSVPGPRFAIATSLNSVSRQLGAALGVAVLIAIIGTPTPAEALHAFQHGWLFAGGCFAVGSLACLALVLAQPDPAGADGAWPGGHSWSRDGSETDRLEAVELDGLELPQLDGSHGEAAVVEPQSVADFLRNVPMFAALARGKLEQVAQLAGEVQLARGQWLFREGDHADAVYVLRVGHLEVLQHSHEQRDDEAALERINTLTRGAVLGELALLSDSARSASIRALRDSRLLRIERAAFDALLRSDGELALSLVRVLSAQLQASRAAPVARRARPVTIALYALAPSVRPLEFADRLSRAMCAWGRVAVLHSGENGADGDLARFAPLVERCEQDHDHVLMVCGHGGVGADAGAAPGGRDLGTARGGPDRGAAPGGTDRAWEEFCVARADRVLALVDAGADAEAGAGAGAGAGGIDADLLERLRGCDLVAVAVRGGSGCLERWVSDLAPASVFAIGVGSERADIARTARRLTGRAPGVVLSGGGARAFAHLGALDVLLDAGLRVDRVAGVSMGSFVGGLLACGYDSAAIDACCYEEWVRRNPINDYTVPRVSLIKGDKAQRMLERVFGELRLEELARPYYCASVNLRGSELVIDRYGSMVEAIGASISLPLIAPPLRREQSLLIDGSLLDNLPLAPMSSSGEGPVLALDVKGGEERREPLGARPTRMPALPETMARIALLSSANTDESARRYADFTIATRVPGVGLLEFHQIDAARSAGRAAALAALAHAPAWLSGGATPPADLSGRRTVVRV